MRVRAQTVPVCAGLFVGIVVVLSSSAAVAVPTSLNLMPSADVVGNGRCLVELEDDGCPTPFAEGPQWWLLTNFGLGDRLEVGLNRLECPGVSRWFMDAKLQLVPESDRLPALSVGATDITRCDEDSVWYVVGTKGVGPVRATVGYQHDDFSHLMLGGAYSVSKRLTLLSDCTTGPRGWATLGLCQDIGHGCSVLLYYARNNSDKGDSFTGLNLTWSGEWRPGRH
jgi:hypothetical protein